MPSLQTNPTDAEISFSKQKLRSHYRNMRKSISPEARELLDVTLCANAAELPAIKSAKTLLFYYPIKGEPNLKNLISWALSNKKQIAFPISNSDTCTLSFRYVDSISELSAGAYGIPEPSADARTVTDFKSSVCIVPGLVFDNSGYRIGYGKGYYDRFIYGFEGLSVGMVYSRFCLSSTLPRDNNDMPVDMIITERGIIIPNATKRQKEQQKKE